MDIEDLDKFLNSSDKKPNIMQRMILLEQAIEHLEKMTAVKQITILARFLGLNYHEIGLLLGVDSHKPGRPKKNP